MDYHLVYTQRALDDLAEIIGHIAENDSETASRFGNSLISHVELLTRFPRIGELIRKRAQIRKLIHSPISHLLSRPRIQASNRDRSHPPRQAETAKVGAASESLS